MNIILLGGWILLAPAPPPPPAPAPSVPEGLLYLQQGDAEAEAGRFADALFDYKRAYDRLLPSIRGLEFREETPVEVIGREKLKDRLGETFDEEDKRELIFFDRALKAFGVLPKVMSLEPLMLSLLGAEVGGYYDPKRKQITLVDNTQSPKEEAPPSFWADLLTDDEEFSIEENRGVIAHELTHALTDQHFDLTTLQERCKEIDDASMAIDAVIEGDAMIAMMAAMQSDYARASRMFEAGSGYWKMAFSLLAGLAPELSGEVLRAAPPFFAKTLMFPYSDGMVFLLEVGEARGYEAVDEVYRSPPDSTEQILHPERYLTRDTPFAIEEPGWRVPPEYKRLGSNVLGEVQTRYVLEDEDAAAGWGGDRYTVFEGAPGVVLAWMTVWDTPTDAREFSNAWRRYVAERLNRDQARGPAVLAPFSGGTGGTGDFRHIDRAFEYRIMREGVRVVVLEGPASSLDAFARDAWRATESPKRSEPIK